MCLMDRQNRNLQRMKDEGRAWTVAIRGTVKATVGEYHVLVCGENSLLQILLL